MKTCGIMKTYKGTKSEKIQEMVNDKLIKKAKKGWTKALRNPHLKRRIAVFKNAKKRYKKAMKDLQKLEEKFNIHWRSNYGGRGKYEFSDHQCFVPKKTRDELEEAQRLNSLGKPRDAKKIWDKVMKEYKIVRF